MKKLGDTNEGLSRRGASLEKTIKADTVIAFCEDVDADIESQKVGLWTMIFFNFESLQVFGFEIKQVKS